ncbi:hypothetical protein IBX65_06390, partial [Candidatus Aerophobetes bacterium]|nr:hypothetical protein [Candidatus Aerophobetes bacterium]
SPVSPYLTRGELGEKKLNDLLRDKLEGLAPEGVSLSVVSLAELYQGVF